MHNMQRRHSLVLALSLIATISAFSPLAFAQVQPARDSSTQDKLWELSANFGRSGLQGVDAHHHFNYGGAIGYHLTPKWTLTGEYTQLPLGSVKVNTPGGTTETANGNDQIIGAGLRYNFQNFHGITPYTFIGFGFTRESTSYTAGAVNMKYGGNGYNADGGAGLTFHMGKSWGFRPEIRWDRQNFFENGSQVSRNIFIESGQIYFQFGGRGKKK